jgi:signal transduction histidine kinase
MLPRSLSLSAQLLIAFVGLVVGTTAALTLSAYRSSLESLENDARRSALAAADERAIAVVRLFRSRQQRAEGFLAAAESLCAEPRRDGGFGWSVDCVSTLMEEFRATEQAIGVHFSYRGFTLVESGDAVSGIRPEGGALAGVSWNAEGMPEYVMVARRGGARLITQFDNVEVASFLADRSGLGEDGEVFLVGPDGRFLTPPRYSATGTPAGARVTEPVAECRAGARSSHGLDYRGVETFHGLTPVPALGGGCVDAHFAYAEALAPAEQLRNELIARGGVFALAGALLSLLAAQWIAGPVRRLVAAARGVQAGQFSRPVPLHGPTEVRELGRAFATMADALGRLVTREKAARTEAERANQAKDEFLATVSHELRTPLTAIMGWARLLRDGNLDPASAARALAAIERNAEAQRRLINDLLDVSRIIRGQLQFEEVVVPLAAVVDAALETVNPQAADKGVAIARQVGGDPILVLGDAQRLQQVVWNVVWNAVKFTPSGGRVTVTLGRVGGQAELIVADTGIGMDSEFVPHVFDWFRQADAASTRTYSGLGVGLGLVHQIVTLHGGEVRADSAGPGLGSTFTVTLPIYERTAFVPALAVAAQRPAADLRAIRVLVVDDDEETVEAVRAVLTQAGAAVETAVNAEDARREVEAFHPTVLISDLAMPREDGYTLMRSLRSADITVPAIALTAYARREDADRALAAGFQVHLAKPVDPASLIDTVATLAGGMRPH